MIKHEVSLDLSGATKFKYVGREVPLSSVQLQIIGGSRGGAPGARSPICLAS